MKANYLCLFLFIFSITINAQNEKAMKPFSTEGLQLIDSTLLLFPDQTELAIAVIKNKEINFVGFRNEDKKIVSVDNKTSAFEIGSITKLFTAHLLINSLHRGLIDSLAQDFSSSISAPIKKGTPPISFLELANHTSGLPPSPTNWKVNIFNYKNPYESYTKEDLLEYLAEEITLSDLPSDNYQYSNLGMGILGYSLSLLNQKSYESLLREQIFLPLGMINSTSQRKNIRTFMVQGLNKKGKPTSNWDFNVLAPAGAIISTPEDMSQYMKWALDALQNDYKILIQESHKINKDWSIGLGWHIINSTIGKPIVWHNGGTRGYKSCMALQIDHETAVLILSNISSSHDKKQEVDQLCFSLLKSMHKN